MGLKFDYKGKEDVEVGNFLSQTGISNELSVDEFLQYSFNGQTNLDLIWALYDEKEQLDNESSYQGGSLPYIKPCTTVVFPKDSIDVEKTTIYGVNQVNTNGGFEFFLKGYLELLKTDGYVKAENLALETENFTVQQINENVRVWLYIRAIDEIVNLSPYIRNLNTSKSGDAGSFNLTLDPIVDLLDPIFIENNVINNFNISNSEGHVLDFFEKNVQQNDVIFIRFERLEQEKTKDIDLQQTIPVSSLQSNTNDRGETFDRVWDMIGLVDNINSSYSAASTDKQISINGRDLIKVLVDDGAYFLPYRYIEGKDDKNKFVWGGDTTGSWFNRNVISGAYDYFFAYDVKKIQDALGFIINHLSNIGIVDNRLFSSFTNKSEILTVSGADANYLKSKEVDGIWQIIKLNIDPSLDNRVYAGNSLGNPDGTLVEFFNQICQRPFVEFWGDTYGSYFHLTVRRPPFDGKAIQGIVNDGSFISIKSKDLLGYNLNYDTRAYSSYELEPNNNFFGAEDGLFKAIVPVLFLEKYAENFGNKRMSETDSYLFLDSLYGDNSSNLKNSKFLENFLEDLKYMIDSNSYLPFTRTGTITMNGDRRIKKGSFVLLEDTGELFHVTGVNNSATMSRSQIDRTTTLNVERGMVYDYISKSSTYNYFNIVNTDLYVSEVRQKLEPTSKAVGVSSVASTNYSVNEDSFNFFFKRQQFNFKDGI